MIGNHVIKTYSRQQKVVCAVVCGGRALRHGGGIGGGAKSEKGNPIVHIDEAVPGTGVMDYPTIMKRLGELPQEITLHVEHFEYEDTIAGQQYIRSVARQVGVKVR